MKQEEDKWTRAFRERLEDYSESVPEDVWQRLETSVSSAQAASPNRFRSIAIAAAVVLLLLSSVGVYLLTNYSSFYIRKVSVPMLTQGLDQEEVTDSKEEVLGRTTPSRQLTSVVSVKKNSIETNHREIADVLEIMPETKIKNEPVVAQTDVIDKQQPDQADQQKAVSRPPNQAAIFARNLAELPKKRRSKPLSIALSVGNNVLASASDNSGFQQFSNIDRVGPMVTQLYDGFLLGKKVISTNAQDLEAYERVMIKNFNKNTKTSIKHSMPVTFGLSVRKELSDLFSLETGLTYTLLSSELRAGEDSYYTQDQKLHYLGIPLKGSWLFFNKKYFNLYLSAGGMAEACVSSSLKTHYVVENENGHVGDSDIDVNKLQWSVSAAVGAQYNATRYLGIYVEPGVVYYFNDGSNVQTIRKEKPFNLNLQMGVRFSY